MVRPMVRPHACRSRSRSLGYTVMAVMHLALLGYRGLGNAFDDDIPGIAGLPSLPTSVTGTSSCQIDGELGLVSYLPPRTRATWVTEKTLPVEQPLLSSYQYSPEVQKAIESILYIADHIKKEDDDNNVSF